jgi:quercetin dioxygenase-like cupin family protein
VLRFSLDEERRRIADPDLLARNGRNARTLLKEASMRVTLIELAAGGEIPYHHAAGPITVQPLEGVIRFRVGDDEHELGPGTLLSVPAGVTHAVSSADGATFLLTVSQDPSIGGRKEG